MTRQRILVGAVNCWQATRRRERKTSGSGRSGLFQCVCTDLLWYPLPVLVIRMSFSSGTGRVTFSWEILWLIFRQKKVNQRVFLHLLFFQMPSAQNSEYVKASHLVGGLLCTLPLNLSKLLFPHLNNRNNRCSRVVRIKENMCENHCHIPGTKHVPNQWLLLSIHALIHSANAC